MHRDLGIDRNNQRAKELKGAMHAYVCACMSFFLSSSLSIADQLSLCRPFLYLDRSPCMHRCSSLDA